MSETAVGELVTCELHFAGGDVTRRTERISFIRQAINGGGVVVADEEERSRFLKYAGNGWTIRHLCVLGDQYHELDQQAQFGRIGCLRKKS